MKVTYQEPKFWIIWNPERENPTRKHQSLAKAEVEAKRLAKNQPGETFYILSAIMAVAQPPSLIKYHLY